MIIAILAAMKEELAPFRQYFGTKEIYSKGKCVIEKSTFNQHEILLVETGIGKVNAAFTTTLLCQTSLPDLMINTGSAGGLSSKVSIGDVVFSNEFIYSDVDATAFNYNFGQVPQMPSSYFVIQQYIELFEQIPREKNNYQSHIGQIVTSDSFMSNQENTNYVKTNYPNALASDMEGTAIAQVAAFYEVPVLNIRSISDMAGNNAAETFDSKLDTAAKNAFNEVITICHHL